MTQDLMKLVDEYATRRIGEGTAKARAAVVAAIDALTKDAERYRWLRRPTEHSNIYAEVRIGEYRGVYWSGTKGVTSGLELDNAIDAAIAAQKGEQA